MVVMFLILSRDHSPIKNASSAKKKWDKVKVGGDRLFHGQNGVVSLSEPSSSSHIPHRVRYNVLFKIKVEKWVVGKIRWFEERHWNSHWNVSKWGTSVCSARCRVYRRCILIYATVSWAFEHCDAMLRFEKRLKGYSKDQMVCSHKCCGDGKNVLEWETKPPSYTKQRYQDPEKEKVREKLALSDLLQHNPKSYKAKTL
nr:hypothetical protein [Tanacetum cinerariifolium]